MELRAEFGEEARGPGCSVQPVRVVQTLEVDRGQPRFCDGVRRRLLAGQSRALERMRRGESDRFAKRCPRDRPSGRQRGHSDDRIRSGLGHDTSDAGDAGRLGDTHQTLEFAVGSEDVVPAAADIHNRHSSVGEDRHGAPGVAELARTFTPLHPIAGSSRPSEPTTNTI